jgi:anhydro-N-acetylmuramic acid kinase
MSGTSLDGVDVALIETDGERIGRFGPASYRAYTDGERDLLRKALAHAVSMTDRNARPGVLADAEELRRAHAEAVETFCKRTTFHAQTSTLSDFMDRRSCIALSRN